MFSVKHLNAAPSLFNVPTVLALSCPFGQYKRQNVFLKSRYLSRTFSKELSIYLFSLSNQHSKVNMFTSISGSTRT